MISTMYKKNKQTKQRTRNKSGKNNTTPQAYTAN